MGLRRIELVAAALLVASPVHASPTFNKDIAPILWAHCATCHRPGEMAPFSLVEYRDVMPRVRQIATVTANRTMPPWLPEGSGTFVNERRLKPEEIAAIQ